MGEVAEMMLDGTLCEQCGVYVGDPLGYPRKCSECKRTDKRLAASHNKPGPNTVKVACPICNRRVKKAGLSDHQRDAHPTPPRERDRQRGVRVRVLVACESSGVVREAFRKRGHDAWSADLLPADDGSPFHIQGDARLLLKDGWDLLIAHPPCTHLSVSGARWFAEKRDVQQDALDFFCRFLCAPVPRIAVENPVSIVSSWVRKPDQIIQPHMFGHPEFKATCLWLKGLPLLRSTNQLALPTGIAKQAWERVHRLPPSVARWKERSKTFEGIADAFAEQWGTPQVQTWTRQQMESANLSKLGMRAGAVPEPQGSLFPELRGAGNYV